MSSNSMISNRTNSSSSNGGREVCKYFLHGMCRYGENCYFSHNRNHINNNNTNNQQQSTTEATSSNSNSNICKYYLQGRCMFGESCYNRHARPSSSSSNANVTNGAQSQAANSEEEDDEDEENGDDEDDEISYETVTTTRNSKGKANETDSSSTTSPSSQSSSSSIANSNNNSELVKRSLGANKPKLRLTAFSSSSNGDKLSVAAKPFEPKNSITKTNKNEATTASSYYEALTGKKLNYNELDLNSSELNMFEPAYAEYLRKKKANFLEEAASAVAAAAVPSLCPYSELQLACPFDEAGTCEFRHLIQCDQCQRFALDVDNVEQQKAHRAECMQAIEAEMEEAFAVAASREKLCGICMEVVWEKEPVSERRFGILESCNHVFCLSCIRKWRASKAYENKVVKACPECRVKSDYVTPSRFWFDNEDAKKRIINDYKSRLSKTACKYFKQGDGTCPFGNKCFYLHQYKDGRLATNLPEPTRRRRVNRDGNIESYQNLIRIELSLLEDDDGDDLDSFYEYFRNNYLWDTSNDTDSDVSDFFEFSNEFFSLF